MWLPETTVTWPYDLSVHVPVPVHIGHPLPSPDATLDDAAITKRPLRGNQVRRSALDKVTIDWEKHEVEPRWIGADTVDGVVALQAGHSFNRSDRERDRFLAGAAERGETALLISMLGYADDDTPRSVMRPGAGGGTVDLVAPLNYVHGTRLPPGTKAKLAADLAPAEQDHAKRLLARPTNATWWGLSLRSHTVEPSSGPPETYPVAGELRPILIDALGQPVVAVWVAPDEHVRWYIVPDEINWDTVLDWLVHQAIPAYVPQAARRHRTSSFVATDLLTPAERND